MVLRHLLQRLPEVPSGYRVEARRRLVEESDLCIGREHGRDHHLAALAAREFAVQASACFSSPIFASASMALRLGLSVGDPPPEKVGRDRLHRRHPWHRPRLLWDGGDPLAQLLRASLMTSRPKIWAVPGRGLELGCQDPDKGRLPGPVHAYEREDPARGDAQVDAIQRLLPVESVVYLGEVLGRGALRAPKKTEFRTLPAGLSPLWPRSRCSRFGLTAPARHSTHSSRSTSLCLKPSFEAGSAPRPVSTASASGPSR